MFFVKRGKRKEKNHLFFLGRVSYHKENMRNEHCHPFIFLPQINHILNTTSSLTHGHGLAVEKEEKLEGADDPDLRSRKSVFKQ